MTTTQATCDEAACRHLRHHQPRGTAGTLNCNISAKHQSQKQRTKHTTSVASNETSTTTFLSDDEYSKRQVTAMLVSSHFRSRIYVYLLSCTERRPNTDPWPATGTPRLTLTTHRQLCAGSVSLTRF